MRGAAVLIDFQADGWCQPGSVEGRGLGEKLVSRVEFPVVEIVFEIHIVEELDLGFLIPGRPGEKALGGGGDGAEENGREDDSCFFHHYPIIRANIARNSIIFVKCADVEPGKI